jgi:hypothetical protein
MEEKKVRSVALRFLSCIIQRTKAAHGRMAEVAYRLSRIVARDERNVTHDECSSFGKGTP